MNQRLSGDVMVLLLGLLATGAIILALMDSHPVVTSAQTNTAIESPGADTDAIPRLEIAAARVEANSINSVATDNVPESREISRPRPNLPVGIERLSRTLR